MKKGLFCTLIFNLFSIFTFGQSDFYSTDSTILSGIQLLDGGEIDNARFCQVKQSENILKYSPYEIKEFGFSDGRIYRSFQVENNDTISRYFLERLFEGKVNLYYLKVKRGICKYYVMKGDSSQLFELLSSNDNYSLILESIMADCPQAIRNIQYLKLNKLSLIRLIKDYNVCVKRPFPRLRSGFMLGFNAIQLFAENKNSMYSVPNYKIKWSISAGVFMDVPIQYSNFSFHPELNFKQNNISLAFENDNTSNDLVINYSSINFPLLLKYTLLRNRLSPFFQVGPVYSKAIKNMSTLYRYQEINNNIFIDIIDTPVMQDDMGGFLVGGGIISKYGSKYSWFGEINYGGLYNLRPGKKILGLRECSLRIGFIF